jgi:hypothetical protein
MNIVLTHRGHKRIDYRNLRFRVELAYVMKGIFCFILNDCRYKRVV